MNMKMLTPALMVAGSLFLMAGSAGLASLLFLGGGLIALLQAYKDGR